MPEQAYAAHEQADEADAGEGGQALDVLCSMHISAPKSALVTPIAIRIARSAATCPCIGPLRRKPRYSWTRAWIPRSEATA